MKITQMVCGDRRVLKNAYGKDRFPFKDSLQNNALAKAQATFALFSTQQYSFKMMRSAVARALVPRVAG